MFRRLTEVIENARFVFDLAAEVLAAVVRGPAVGPGLRLG
jgi:hypothetical protein